MNKKANSSKKNYDDETSKEEIDIEHKNKLIHNQLLLASTITALGRTEQPSSASHIINVSLLHLNEFNVEFEYELSQNSLPVELLESEHKLLKARENLLAEIEQQH